LVAGRKVQVVWLLLLLFSMRYLSFLFRLPPCRNTRSQLFRVFAPWLPLHTCYNVKPPGSESPYCFADIFRRKPPGDDELFLPLTQLSPRSVPVKGFAAARARVEQPCVHCARRSCIGIHAPRKTVAHQDRLYLPHMVAPGLGQIRIDLGWKFLSVHLYPGQLDLVDNACNLGRRAVHKHADAFHFAGQPADNRLRLRRGTMAIAWRIDKAQSVSASL